MSLEILYWDDAIAVAVKPVGVSAQEGGDLSMPGLLRQTLGGECFTVHRLDQNVGGVMVYARTRQAAAALSRAIQENTMEKAYLAMVHGQVQPESGTMEDILFKDSSKRKVFVVKTLRKGARKAKLQYSVVQQGLDRAMVRILLHTGRTHQIRVQFASRKHPLFGDRKYGARDGLTAPALWSHRLAFPHPTDGRRMEFSAEPSAMVWNMPR